MVLAAAIYTVMADPMCVNGVPPNQNGYSFLKLCSSLIDCKVM